MTQASPGQDADRWLADIRGWARESGFSQIGVADIDLSAAEPGLLAWMAAGFAGEMHYFQRHGLTRARPAALVPGTVRVITARMDYLPADTPEDWVEAEWRAIADPLRAQVSLYARGRDYHKVLRQRLQRLADRIADTLGPFGYRAFTDSAPVLEVELATRSGLGWRGRHTLALDREGGSMFFLGELFVSLPLALTEPVDDHCGRCTACLGACPTGALVAPGRLDARRCISYLTLELDGPIPVEFRRAMGNRIAGCDDCQLACPWNKFARRAVVPDFDARAEFQAPTLLDFWRWSEADFLRRTEGSALRRIGHRRWQRNLAVAMGNALGGSLDPAAREALLRALRTRRSEPGVDAVVAETIDWALAQAESAPNTASASGTLTMPSSVDTVTSPATKGPSPPIRDAST